MKEVSNTVGVAQQLVSFGDAVKALKEGKMVQRKGWNGKGMFIFMQVPSRVSMEFVGKMTSLPQDVKDEFFRRFEKANREVGSGAHNFSTIDYHNQIAIVYPDNTIHGWSPSTADGLAEDWIILSI